MADRPALAALTALNVEICALTGAGKGADTTQEALKAYWGMMYARRAEVAAAIEDAERELRNLPRATGTHDGRFYIAGMRAALERVTRP